MNIEGFAGVGDTTGDGSADMIVSLQELDGGTFKFYAFVYYDQPFMVARGDEDVDSPDPSISYKIAYPGYSSPMSVASAGDFNNDNLGDILIGDQNGVQRAAVIFGDSSFFGMTSELILSNALTSASQGVFITGPSSSYFGQSIALAGRINDDDYDDIIIGAVGYDSVNGAAFIITGGGSFSADIDAVTDGYIIKHSTGTGKQLGMAVYGNLAFDMSEPGSTVVVCDTSGGSCYFIFKSAFEDTKTVDVDTMFTSSGFAIQLSGTTSLNNLKFANIGDLDGDSYPDILIGASDAGSYDGKVFIMYGPNYCDSPCKTCPSLASADWSTCITCETGFDYFFDDYCYPSCPAGTYLPIGGPAFECSECDSNCKECITDAPICTSCDLVGLTPYLYLSTCYSVCPVEAPYSYLYVCYIQCPTNTAPDVNNACIIVVVLETKTPNTPQVDVKALSSADRARQISNEVMSIISSLFLGGIHSIRSQSVQGPVSYYIFLNVDYPENYAVFGASNFGSSNLPNPFKDTGDTPAEGGRVESVNKYVENQSLLANVGYSILLLLICLLIILLNDLVLAIIRAKKKDYETKGYYKLLRRASISIRWSFLISQFVSKYQDLTFFSFLGIYNAGKDNSDTLNLIVCIIGFLVTVFGLAGVFLIIKKATKKLETFSEEEKEKEEYTKNDFLGRRLVLYKDLDKTRFRTMLYPFFLMVRVFGFNLLTIFLSDQTAMQLVFLNIFGVLMLIYLLKYRPLEEGEQHWVTLGFEIVDFVALFGVTIIAIYNTAGGTSEHTRNVFGYIIIAASLAMMILNFISFFLEIKEYVVLGFEIIRDFMQKRKQRRVTPQDHIQVQSKDPSFVSPNSSFISASASKFGLKSPTENSPFFFKEPTSTANASPIKIDEPSSSINDSLPKIKMLFGVSNRKRNTQVGQNTEIPESEVLFD